MLSTRRSCLRVAHQSPRVEVNNNGVGSLHTGNPTSFYYRLPPGDKPDSLARLLVAVQVRQYGNSAFSSNHDILIRHARLLLEKYPAGRIKRAIHYASWLSDYPYSFAFVEKCIGYLEKYYGL